MQQEVDPFEHRPSESQRKTPNIDWESESTKAFATVTGATLIGASIGDAIASDKGVLPGALIGATFGAGLRAYGFIADHDNKHENERVALAVTKDGRTVEVIKPQRSPTQDAATLIGGTLLVATIANAISSLPYVTYAGACVGLLAASLLVYQGYRRPDR